MSFAAGKVHVYSDFDGTYCPERHSSMHKPVQKPEMVDYCRRMDKLFNSTQKDLDFHVTTGRTFGEYEAVSWLLKIRGYRLPLPVSVIVGNGSDEFVKNGSDSNFYDNGVFPFDYNRSNKDKEKKIKAVSNWDGKSLKSFIKFAAEKACFRFVEAESENSVRDYGNMSLFSDGKLNAHEWKKLPLDDDEILEHEHPKADFALGSRKDGNLKVNLIFPPDYGYCPIRNWIYDNYIDEIKGYLAENNVKYVMSWEDASHRNHHRKSVSLTPMIEERKLTKLYDTKEALLEAAKGNDLVVVAGDGSNDFDMLNPLEYISNEEWRSYAKNSSNQAFYQGDMHKKLRDLKHIYRGNDSEYINELRDELTANGLLKRIDEMPFVGIVVKKDNSKLQRLVDTFGRIGKIVAVENGSLDAGIKQAVSLYAMRNESFRDSMSEPFKNVIFGSTNQ